MVKRKLQEDTNDREYFYMCKQIITKMNNILKVLNSYLDSGALQDAKEIFSEDLEATQETKNQVASSLNAIKKAVDAMDYQLEYIDSGMDELTNILEGLYSWWN